MARPQKALVVDDLAVNRLILGTILQKLGFEVLEAENGLQCIDVYNQERTQLVCVFLDLQMPVADGWAATKGIRELESRAPDSDLLPVPVVVCTASCLDDIADNGQTVAQRAVSLGANGAVRKPLTVYAVQRILDEYAPRWRASLEQVDPSTVTVTSASIGSTCVTNASLRAGSETIDGVAAPAPAPAGPSHSCSGPKPHAQWSSGQRLRPHHTHHTHHATLSAPSCGARDTTSAVEHRAEDCAIAAATAGAHAEPTRRTEDRTCGNWSRSIWDSAGSIQGGGGAAAAPDLCWVPRRDRDASCGGGAGGAAGLNGPAPASLPRTQRQMSCEASFFTAASMSLSVSAAASTAGAPAVMAVLKHPVAVAVAVAVAAAAQ